ncbi:MAG: arginase [Bacteroidetes bacterium]|nr:formimidoylglutamase [Bacteroidia bacterium]MBN4052257.1 formimidoylglutamase [Sphingobacteriaceae bacterium AH-315-L07]PCH66300.1 MAG: arginase [Bacteroidota bacterium]
MTYEEFLTPIEKSIITSNEEHSKNCLSNHIDIFTDGNSFPDISDTDIAIIGVEEDRNGTNNTGASFTPNRVREQFYQLHKGHFNPNISDLGNIVAGNKVQDTYVALTNIVTELIDNKIIPIIIGGTQDLAYAQYQGYQNLGQTIDLVIADSKFDLGNLDETDPISSNNHLFKIITHHPNFLFNVTVLGYQTYYVDQPAIETFEKLNFDSYRLGEVRSNIEEVEPIVRTADMLSFDMSAIKQADAPGNNNANPNGFYGEEACQIIRYAGLSNKLSSIGFYELNPEHDNRGQTSTLLSQMIWYFIEGYYSRSNDLPIKEKKEFTKYITSFKNNDHELIFFKSNQTNKWWMEVPIQDINSTNERHQLIPCSYKDYQSACDEEVPNRWWQAYNKLN